MSLPPKIVTILCLLQCFVVTAGFLLARGFLKTYVAAWQESRVPPWAGFVRSFGLWFLLVPLIWCGFAIWRGEVTQGISSITLGQLITGVALTIILVIIFSIGVVVAFHDALYLS